MNFNEIVKQRYATKKFDGKIIPEEKINELFDLIIFSASSLNLQPWKIKVIKDKETKELLFPVSRNQQQIITCSHLLVFCADTDIEDHNERLVITMRKEKIPEENIMRYSELLTNKIKKMSEHEKLIWAQRQMYIALGNALNGAKSLGFDSCPMEGFDSKEYSRILKLPSNLHPTALCPVGYAAVDDVKRPKVRFSKEEMFF
jgi:nitroreductase